MSALLANYLRNESGDIAFEYGLAVAAVAGAIIAAIRYTGFSLSDSMDTLMAALK